MDKEESPPVQAADKEPVLHTVRFEPVGVDMSVAEGETVLDAAFRQGIAVMHGCKEGQCSSCKSLLLEGDVEMKKYSTFALPDYERESGHILLCRTLAYSDLTVELLNYDEDLMRRSIPVSEYDATLTAITHLTHDIRLLEVQLSRPLRFWAGQYVDLTIPAAGITRSFSMANAPDGERRLQFIIKKYPNGAFSSQLDEGLKPGDRLVAKGPYGTCFRREDEPGPLVLVGGGSGMSPLWSILNDHVRSGERRPVRFFYGARTRRDLFYLDKFAEFADRLPDFRFIPALSHAQPEDAWTGETGFIHDVVSRVLRDESLVGDIDAYACGPTAMIDAVIPALQMAGVEPERLFFDKFTQAVR
ncbi:CDP-6-deoxy-delta-3,4-glucoseen reductase [Burkholderia sp. SG-MS1]|uniref:NADH:ubiquinone reductase (Na(+)-transporting) subunit F n=1 Tax=Paraburkholderia sp. SG-MS1 TaxID=2023741 RepID=UPI0014455BD8|nr:FAD-binding oxidoreductase [Paraburkholderia sp. SG-MS1]NKJ45597.1 CDP-6-deoxy-delta-3,4-glucoseen reductase [Paraburkholderia sp. SG-MS1]